MAHRGRTGRSDKRIFRNTATSVKEINISPKPMRGGTRL